LFQQAPPAIFALAAIYLVSYIIEFVNTSPYNIVEDEIVIVDRFLPPREAAALGVPSGTEEIDIVETVIAEEKPPHVFSTLLTGLPSATSLLASLATLLVNLALVGMVIDLTYRSHVFWPEHDLKFARLGYVAEDSARILVREPDVKQLPIFLSVRYADAPLSTGVGNRALDSAWRAAGSTHWLNEDTDFTTTFTIKHLLPDTRYQYALSNNVSGYFITAPPVGQVSQRRDAHKTFSFMHTSCIKPRFPYDPREHPLAITGFKHLSKWIGALRPSFMMFLGDFIYVDVPQRHGKDIETYRRGYRQVYGSPDWPAVSSTRWTSTNGPDYDIPWLHVYDDHEIANDWDANVTGYYASAFDPYQHYHLSVNPPLFLETSVTPKDLALDKSLPTWMVFNQGPASFFVLDTRRYRDSNNHAATDPDASMLGKAQLISLLTWLSAPVPAGVHWKIVISSVPFTKNWRVNAADTWGNYLVERQSILEAMWTTTTVSGIGIVILSGDRHEFAATAFPPPVDDERWLPQASVHEFSASPLNMFYIPYSSYQQTDLEDVCIKYIRDGNSKFGYVEIGQPTLSGQSILTYRLFVDGEEAWSHVLVSAGGIDGAMQRRKGSSGHRQGAIQWVKEEGKWMQHEIEEAEHWVTDKAHAAGDRVKSGLQTGEHWVNDEAHATEDNIKSSVRAGEHYVDDTIHTAANKAHYAEKAALGGLFAGWSWFGNKARAAEHIITSDAAKASDYAKYQAHKNADRASNAAGHAKDEIVDEARHASQYAAHGARAATSNVKEGIHKAEDFASRQTDNVKHQVHDNAQRARDVAARVEHEVIDEARHVVHGAQSVTSNVKEGVHRAETFASRQTDNVKNQVHKGADLVKDAEDRIKSDIVDDALHASYRVVHGAQAITSSVKEGVRKAEDFAARQTDNAKLQVHKGADYVHEGAREIKDGIVDEAHHASYRVAYGASAAAEDVKAGASKVSGFASRQAHAGSYTISSLSSKVASGVKAGEQYGAEKARYATDAAKRGEQKVEEVVKGAGHAAVSSARAATDAVKRGEQKIAREAKDAGKAAAEAARKAEQKVEQKAKEAAHQAASAIRKGEQKVGQAANEAASSARLAEQKVEQAAKHAASSARLAEQKVEQAAKHAAKAAVSPIYAAGSAISRGEEYLVDEITSAGAAATQAGKHIAHDAAHAGHHIAEDLKVAGQHVREDAKEFGGHVREDLKEAVPLHHRTRQVVHTEEVVEGIRRKAIGTEDFLHNAGQTVVSVGSSVTLEGRSTVKSGMESVVTSMSQGLSGDDGWHQRDVEEAVAAGVAGVAAMGGVGP